MPVFLSLVIVPASGFQSLKLPVTETVSACGAQTRKSVPVMRPSASRWTMAPRVCCRGSAAATAVALVGSGTGECAASTGSEGSGAGRAISCAAASRKSVAPWGSSRVPSRKRTMTESGSTRTSLTRAPAGTSTFPATRPSYMAGKVTSSRRVTVSGWRSGFSMSHATGSSSVGVGSGAGVGSARGSGVGAGVAAGTGAGGGGGGLQSVVTRSTR